MKNRLPIIVAVVVTFLVTLYGLYSIQTKQSFVLDFSESQAGYGQRFQEEEPEPIYLQTFYDWWMCTVGATACVEEGAATGPRRR